MKLSSKFRQRTVALTDRILEECLRGQPADIAMHAVMLTLAYLAQHHWEDPRQALTNAHERVAGLVDTLRYRPGRVCPQGQDWKRMIRARQRA